MTAEWHSATASDLGRAIGAGKVDPVDLLESFWEVIGPHELAPRIYARMTMDRAMAEAQAAAQRAKTGQRLGLLDGVPVSWKDLFDTAGDGTEAGSKLLEGRVPGRDARVLETATLGGSVCLGKTHMSELAFSGLGYNPSTETPPCVNNPEAVAGGSSSGAAASVAFGLAPAAIGSDTGGSVRVPAAWNDLVGLKTTSGRISLDGVVPLAPQFDTVGPLCRSVEDAGQILALLEGTQAADLRGASLSGRRLAVLKTVAMDDLSAQVAEGFDSAVARLNAAGARIDTIEIPHVEAALSLSGALYPTEAYGIWRDIIEAAPHLMFDNILERFRGGAEVSAPDYVAAWETLRACRSAYGAATAAYDAVLIPTSPILPPELARLESDEAYYVTSNLLTLRNTRIGNLMGLSALTLPTGVPSVGISLMTPPNTEEKLLRLGQAAEAALA